MISWTRRFAPARLARLKRDDGATAVEYALIIGLIAVVIVVSVALLGSRLSSTFSSAAGALTGATDEAGTVADAGGGGSLVPVASRPGSSGGVDGCGATQDLVWSDPGSNRSCTVNLPTSYDGVNFVYTTNGSCTNDCSPAKVTLSGGTISIHSDYGTGDSATFRWCYSYPGSATYPPITSTCFTVTIT